MSAAAGTGPQAFDRSLAPDIDELSRLTEAVEEFVSEASVPAADVHRITLSVDELLTNVVQYGTAPGTDPQIRIRIEVFPAEVRVHIENRGPRFDPFEDAASPDTNLPLHARPIGGLGVHFVKTLMSSVEYKYSGGLNCITLTRLLSDTAQEADP